MEGVSEHQKAKFRRVLGKEYMSSEEEATDEDGTRFFIIHRPSYRAEKITNSFESLDVEHFARLNKRSLNQTAKRKIGPDSLKSPPKGAPKYVLKKN